MSVRLLARVQVTSVRTLVANPEQVQHGTCCAQWIDYGCAGALNSTDPLVTCMHARNVDVEVQAPTGPGTIMDEPYKHQTTATACRIEI